MTKYTFVEGKKDNRKFLFNVEKGEYGWQVNMSEQNKQNVIDLLKSGGWSNINIWTDDDKPKKEETIEDTIPDDFEKPFG